MDDDKEHGWHWPHHHGDHDDHHHHHPHTHHIARSVDLMSFPTGPVNIGDTGTGTATALDANGNTATTATVNVISSDPSVMQLSDGGSVEGVDTQTWTAVGAGSYTLTGSATNVDGSVVDTGANNPLSGTVNQPTPPPDLATSVTLA